ncbi:PREDICTED: low-density lipoprotein receptor-related protein 2-like [Priapulus caudatus]|uniref:Low-density lipoprotein receptor-related protein 2-like n=1 Tax=Priapulus caudatus TaxID=37621 RepID=A0ABM1F8F2_PRICU|nr:PREDICTED: low-density lipoprotein receptor-related protein 2-like [Priapulus caudatus]
MIMIYIKIAYSVLFMMSCVINKKGGADALCSLRGPVFHCTDGTECIPASWRCDGATQCTDKSDEIGCNNSYQLECESTEFQCHDNRMCINKHWVCDGMNDCIDGSDELSGCQKLCSQHEKSCRSPGTGCVPASKWCDGKKDCYDGSDEDDCESVEETCMIEKDMYTCSTGECIHLRKFCDGNADCVNGTDEDDLCQANMCNTTTCTGGKCWNTPAGALCTCPHGFTKTESNTTSTCVDINECEGQYGLCSQVCENVPGTYLCKCTSGYIYSKTANTCEAEGLYPLLFFSTKKEIRAIYLEKAEAEYFSVYKGGHAITSVSYDSVDSKMYWLDGCQVRSCSMGNCGESVATVISNGFVRPEKIAVDSLARRLYVIDSNLKEIIACDLEGIICTSFVKGLSNPKDLVISPSMGTMYWIDWGQEPKIERADMDGSNRITLFSSSLGHPNSLTLDSAISRLYWTETQLQKVETSRLDGTDRREVDVTSVAHPFSIAVFQDKLYWSDWMMWTLMSANKFTGNEQHTLLKERNILPIGLHIYHSVQEPTGRNPCQSARCSHLCVLAAEGGHTCTCPAGHKLHANGRICVERSDMPYVLVSSYDKITKLYTESLGNGDHTHLPVVGLQEVTALAVDEKEHTLYYSDATRNVLNAIDLDSLEERNVVSTGLAMITDMALDFVSNNMYLADAARQSIDVMTLGDIYRLRLVQMTALERPTSIVVHPAAGTMFFTALCSTHGHIDVSFMDGTNIRQFIREETTGTPVTLAIDYITDRLLWYDAKRDLVETISLDGTERMVMIRSHAVISMSVLSGEMYWVDKREKRVYVTEIRNSILDESTSKLLLSTADNYTDIAVVQHRENTVSNACSSGKGGCSHFCLPIPGGRTCKCPVGFSEGVDNKTCTSEKVCADSEWTCDDGACVLKRDVCDGTRNCPDGSDEKPTTCAPCDAGSVRCDSGQCIDALYWCDAMRDCRDGSDENNCTSCGGGYFHCPENTCLTQSRVCNGEPDCLDGSDETGCKAAEPVYCNPEAQFECASGHQRCIPHEWYCDGEADCIDASDEPPNCNAIAAQCADDEFQCQSMECVRWQAVCDGRNDCGDASDEDEWCQHACGLDNWNNGGCSDVCQPTPFGPLCRCYPGQRMGGDNRTCHDIDECVEETHECDQICVNAKASYECRCEEGFLLQADGHTCRPLETNAVLVFSLQHEIRSLTLPVRKYGSANRIYQAGTGPSSIYALSGDAKSGMIYWTDLYKETVHSLTPGSDAAVVTSVIEIPASIAYDWVTGNLYCADQGSSEITVCGKRGNSRKPDSCVSIIQSDIDRPSSIALHPLKGLMLWSDSGTNAKIERASMDGQNRVVIVKTDIEQPLSLTIDLFNEHVYWVDASLDYVGSSDLNGLYRRTVLGKESGYLYHPQGLAMFGSWLYIAEQKALLKLNKHNGRNVTELQKFNPRTRDTPQALLVLHPSLQKARDNPCTSYPGVLCALSQQGHTCLHERGAVYHSTGHHDDGKTSSVCGCQNGGTCSTGIFGEGFCVCTDNYRGTLCEEELKTASGMLWLIGAVCFVLVMIAVLLALYYYRKRIGKNPFQAAFIYDWTSLKDEGRTDTAAYTNPCFDPEEVNNNHNKCLMRVPLTDIHSEAEEASPDNKDSDYLFDDDDSGIRCNSISTLIGKPSSKL